VTDADQPAEKNLVGIGGWLLFYVILQILSTFGVLFTVVGVLTTPDLARSPYFFIAGPAIIATVIGLYLIFGVRKPITRIFHIWFNIIWAGYAAFITLVSGELGPGGLTAVIPALSWMLYWMTSERVWATYCQDTGQSE